jgi:DNA-binding beta-propeller fold protein YncE
MIASQGGAVLPTLWRADTISNATYDNKSFSVSSQGTGSTGLFFKDDGTKMYKADLSTDRFYEYDLSTAWDVSTASYNSVTLYVNAQDGGPGGVNFSPDGTKIYMVGNSNDTVYQYTVTTPWDLSTASYASKSFSVTSENNSPRDVKLSSDGTKMYVTAAEYAKKRIYQYSLSTAFDISTASYDSISINVEPQTGLPTGIFFSSDGLKMYMSSDAIGYIFEYTLSTAWDLSTASYSGNSFDASTQDGAANKVAFKPDGTKMYVLGGNNNTVYQYSTA